MAEEHASSGPLPGIAPLGLRLLRRLVRQDTLNDPFHARIGENVLLLVPEKLLPRYRAVMLSLRLLLALVVIVNLATFLAPRTHFPLLLADMTIGTMAFAIAALLLTWAHTRDLPRLYNLDQLLLLPNGPGNLLQALVLRPFGDILRLFVFYYPFSVLVFSTLVLWIFVSQQASTEDIPGILIVLLFILAFQGPWIVVMLLLMVHTTIREVRTEFASGGNRLPRVIWTISLIALAVAAFVVLIVVVVYLLTLTLLVNLAVSLLLLLVLTLVTATLSLVAMKPMREWSERRLTKLCEEVCEAWQQ